MKTLMKSRKTGIKALWDNVLVKPIKLESKGQFNRPQNEEDKAEIGRVVGISKGI